MQVSEFSIIRQSIHPVKFCSASVDLSDFCDLFRRAFLHTVEQLVAPVQNKAANIASEPWIKEREIAWLWEAFMALSTANITTVCLLVDKVCWPQWPGKSFAFQCGGL